VSAIQSERASEVLARLARVTDPELDESITELGFVTGVAVDHAGLVSIGFRLPTYWCAANFAFLMADDMRREVLGLPWASGVSIALGEHMYAETINRAITGGLSVQAAFAEEADGDLDALRKIFDMKAFQRRQLALLDGLLASGHDVESLLALDVATLRNTTNDPDNAKRIARYLERRGIPGSAGDHDPAFVDEAGVAVTPETYLAHRRVLRRISVNVEFNGALCRGLLAARFGEELPPMPAEPSLLDFVRGCAPGAGAPA
jgi:metal-sulfur cluster biosynthetic enzyme